MMQTSTQTNSAEAVERLRLQCFRDMIRGLGLTSRVTWAGTKYHLTIEQPGWVYNSVFQTLVRETAPSLPPVFKWGSPVDCYAQAAITSLYQGALECALGALKVSLYVSEEMDMAVKRFLPNLAYGVGAFPVQWWDDDDDETKFWVISVTPLTEEHHEFARFIWPSMELRPANPLKYPLVARYLNLYLEKCFGGIHTPYGEIVGCGCVDS